MKPTPALCAALLAFLVAAPTALAASPRTEYRPYNVGLGLLAGCHTLLQVGGACFELDGSEAVVQLSIRDSTFSGISGTWAFRTASDVELSFGRFCDSTGPLSIPTGTARILVWVGGESEAFGIVDGVVCTPGLATTGLVQADFA